MRCGRRDSRSIKTGSSRTTRAPSPPSKLGHGKDPAQTSGPPLLQGDLPSVANLFLLISPSAQIQRSRVFHGDSSMKLIPVKTTSFRRPRFHVQLRSNFHCLAAQQEMYIHWICRSFAIDKNSKDPRIYCAYCDMRNHPRFACKHVEKHRKPQEQHRCTLCAGRHPPCPLSQSTDQWRPRPTELVQAGVQEG